MSKDWKAGKGTVELRTAKVQRPSRIRRDPPPVEKLKSVRAYPSEQETWMVAAGILFFGLALTIIAFAISDYTS